jgi:Spy/CpxP family protein refolding chaperone
MASRAPAPLAIERARHVGLGSLQATLNLTPNQEQVITKILDDYGKYYQNIEDEREDVAEDGKRKILEVLTPKQRERFNQMIQKAR